ncbi:MAG: cytochrome P450 [Nannocystaceae bacterium]
MHIDLTHPDVRANPYPTYAYLREHAPVVSVRRPVIGRVWYLSRYEDVVAALRDPRLVNDRRNVGDGRGDPWWLPKALNAFRDSMITADDPSHRRLRGLVQLAFTPRMIESLRAQVEAVVAERLELLAANSRAGAADLIADFALPVPLAIISTMMGVRPGSDLAFHRMTNRFLEIADRGLLGLVFGARNTIKMVRFFRELIADHRRERRDDLVTALLDAEADGERLSEEEVLSMIFLLLLAGHETTVNLIGNGTLALLDNPAALAELREDPSLLDSAVEELLRYANPVEQTSPRFAKEALEIRGHRIARGDVVIPLVASANRDPAAFERADTLDLRRAPNRHVALGLGIHYCLGAPLARMEGRIAFRGLLERFQDIRLRIPRDRVQWRGSSLVRGLRALPLTVA